MGCCAMRRKASPQGGVISPILSNIFLHHVLDEWFESEVRPRLAANSALVRFADDAVRDSLIEESAQVRVVDGVEGKRHILPISATFRVR